jgi:hypothetical protein
MKRRLVIKKRLIMRRRLSVSKAPIRTEWRTVVHVLAPSFEEHLEVARDFAIELRK